MLLLVSESLVSAPQGPYVAIDALPKNAPYFDFKSSRGSTHSSPRSTNHLLGDILAPSFCTAPTIALKVKIANHTLMDKPS